jgi:cholesterol transport system auxiliary component
MLPVMILLSGCVSRPALVKQSFAFPIPPLASNVSTNASRVLEIRQLRVAAPYDSQPFTYRTGAYSYELDPYAQFLVPPAQALEAPLQGYFENTGLFREIDTQGGPPSPDLIVRVLVTDLYGDFRNKAAPQAVLRMRFSFFAAKNGLPGNLLLQKDYEQRVPFKVRTAAALMGGWNEALKRIMESVSADLKATVEGKHGSVASGSRPRRND